MGQKGKEGEMYLIGGGREDRTEGEVKEGWRKKWRGREVKRKA